MIRNSHTKRPVNASGIELTLQNAKRHHIVVMGSAGGASAQLWTGYARCTERRIKMTDSQTAVTCVEDAGPKRCPFDGWTDLKPTDRCPVCGDFGTMDAEESGNCISIYLTKEDQDG